MLASVDIIFVSPPSKYIYLTGLPIQSQAAISQLYTAACIPPAEPSADFATNPVLAPKVFVPLGNWGISVPPSTSLLIQAQNTVLSPKYFCLQWHPVLQTLIDFLKWCCFVVFGFFSIENPKQFMSMHNFYSLIYHLPNAAYILEKVCCQIQEFWIKSFPLLAQLETRVLPIYADFIILDRLFKSALPPTFLQELLMWLLKHNSSVT